jgi:hypothetical protein
MFFSSNSKSQFWSSKNGITPDKVRAFTHKKYWFECDCGHEFEMAIANISTRDAWCPYCGEQTRKLCVDSSCDMCFQNSVASHPMVEFWDDEKDPRSVIKNCNKLFKVKCEEGHEFLIRPNNLNRGKWCKKCFTKRMSEKYRHSLEKCIERAREIHGDRYDYSEYVKDGKNDKPSTIICKKHGRFEQSMANHINLKCGCPMCVHNQSRSAIKWLKSLETEYPNIRHAEKGGEIRVARYSLDGCSENIAFEFQGCYIHGCPECYPDRKKWNTLCHRTMQDLYDRTQCKVKFLEERGYKVIQMWEHEFIQQSKTELV